MTDWKKNEEIIKKHPVLDDLREASGFRPKRTSDGGKGSSYRPVDKKKFDDNWDKIFGKK